MKIGSQIRTLPVSAPVSPLPPWRPSFSKPHCTFNRQCTTCLQEHTSQFIVGTELCLVLHLQIIVPRVRCASTWVVHCIWAISRSAHSPYLLACGSWLRIDPRRCHLHQDINGVTCIVCPWHGWAYSMDSGECLTRPVRCRALGLAWRQRRHTDGLWFGRTSKSKSIRFALLMVISKLGLKR